ncbi:TonB-dependent siderophore receptor [Paracoccus caeni]|uniref:TonB-dependent siderophore receptor n=1 Tax=Paracoccus caeni TaxID=657651 RepID=A0A934SCE7_9RHOB|nr:TonB-dependent siderophore receptor [Paracoccus caeni]MBK4215337.1 TonB-dependent siderophore receptor [Paracoccus caeni]
MSLPPLSILRGLLTSTLISTGFVLPAAAQTSTAEQPILLDTITLGVVDDTLTEGTGSYDAGAAETATGLPLSIRETPQSVSVVSQQRITDQGLNSTLDALSYTTGINASSYETDRDSISARGFWIGNYIIDGVKVPTYQGWFSGVSVHSSTATYDHIEVLRGATGLLTGTGEPGAAVSITRKRASSDVAGGTVELRYGSWNRLGGTLDLSQPLSGDGRVRSRLIVDVASEESFVDRYSVEKQTYYGTIEADLTSSTRLSFILEHRNHDPRGSTWGGIPLIFSDGTPTDFDRNFSHAPEWAYWASQQTSLISRLEHEFDNGWKATANLGATWRKYDADLVYYSGELDPVTGLGMIGGAWAGSDRNKLLSLDVKMTGPVELFGRSHTLNFGVQADRDWMKRDWPEAIDEPKPPVNFLDFDGTYPRPVWAESDEDWQVNRTTYSAYGSGQFNLSDRLKLVMGARYTDWSGNMYFEYGEGYRKFKHVTPFAGLVYDLSDEWSVYASYTDVFQSQDYRDRNGKYLDPLLGRNKEIGAKGELMDGRVTASLALFESYQDNFGVEDAGHTIPGSPEPAYIGVDGIVSRGVEIEVNGEIQPGWNLFFGASTVKLRDQNDDTFQPWEPTQTVKLFSTYKMQGALSDLTVGGGFRWQNDTYQDVTNSTGTYRTHQGSFAVVDVMARYDINDRWSAQLNVNNLFDKHYYSGSWGEIDFGNPRNATLSVTSTF